MGKTAFMKSSLIRINRVAVVRTLTYASLLLVLASLIETLIRSFLDFSTISLLDLGSEQSFSTLFSSFILLLSSAICLVLFLVKPLDGRYKGWLGLAVIFCFLSVDESVSLHEKVGFIFSNKLGLDFFTYAWILPYSVLLVMFSLSYIKFLFSLPFRFRRLFLLSAFVYLLGAVGVEALEGIFVDDIGGVESLPYLLMVLVEESLEIFGIIIFVNSLLLYLHENFDEVKICLTSKKYEGNFSQLPTRAKT